MSLSAEDQKKYDAAVEAFRESARAVLQIGSDDLGATTEDLQEILGGVFEEYE